MGLPNIRVTFESLAVSAIKRSQKGIVMLLIKDSIANGTFKFDNLAQVKEDKFDAKNYDYIKLVFKGNPFKVIVKTVTNLQEVLCSLEYVKFNYLTYPELEEGDNEIIKSWIFERRTKNHFVKAVLPNTKADYEAIINFTTTGIKVGEKSYETKEYCSRIAGILAGLPATRSATYVVLDEITSITPHENPDEDINDGQLILIEEDDEIKIGRGVNSLTTTNPKKPQDLKKIKILEAMDLMKEDIITTFKKEYVGKINNSYDNKCLFVRAINGYFKDLQKNDILDPNNDCYVDVDAEANRLYLEKRGIDYSCLSDAELKFVNTGSNVFLKGKVQILDTMEDLDFIIGI